MFKNTIDHPLRVLATAALLALGVAFAGCSERTNREDFSSLIRGKTEAEVRKNAG